MSEPGRQEPEEPRVPRGLAIAAWVLLSLFWFTCAAASFLPDARLWGINHLAFYPWPIRVAALAVMALSLLPRSRRAVVRWVAGLSSALSSRRRLVSALLFIASFVLFNAFASSTQLLGDGLYVGNNVERAAKVDPETFGKVLRNPDPIYPGTEMLCLALTRALSNALGVSPLGILRLGIALIGAWLVLVLAASRAPRRPAPDTPPATDPGFTPFVLLALLSGAVQIFFGYVEVYAPLMFFAAMFLVSSRRPADGITGLWAPVLIVLAAIGMHRLGLLLVPALGTIVLWAACGRKRTTRFVRGSYVIAAATVAAPMFALFARGSGPYVLPMTTRGREYAVLSAGHLADVANEVLLLFPGFFVLAGVALALELAAARSRRAARGGDPAAHPISPQEGAGAARAGLDGAAPGADFPEALFGIFLAFPALMFLFFFKPELGMARDWDLFAIATIALWRPVTAALERARRNGRSPGVIEDVWPPVLVMTAVLTAAWIGVNADAGRAVARFESILSYDRTHAAYAYETLASHHRHTKDLPAEIAALENAVAASRNPRLLLTLGLRYHDAGNKEKAVSSLYDCLQAKPDYAEARKSLLQMLLFMGRSDDVLAVSEEGARLSPEDPYYPLFQGLAYVRKGRASDARRVLERCLEMKPGPDAAGQIEQILRSLPRESTGGRAGGDKQEGKP